MSDKLNPMNCPCCGGEAIFVLESEHMTRNCEIIKYGYVACTKWDLIQDKTRREEEAIALWNTRKPMERIVERLREKCIKEKKLLKQGLVDSRFANEYIVALGEAIEIVKEEGGIE